MLRKMPLFRCHKQTNKQSCTHPARRRFLCSRTILSPSLNTLIYKLYTYTLFGCTESHHTNTTRLKNNCICCIICVHSQLELLCESKVIMKVPQYIRHNLWISPVRSVRSVGVTWLLARLGFWCWALVRLCSPQYRFQRVFTFIVCEHDTKFGVNEL